MHVYIDYFASLTHVFIIAFRVNVSVCVNVVLVYILSYVANFVMTCIRLKPYFLRKPCVLL
jgi:hypothetical protein